MKRLLSIELQKIWLSRSSRILSIAYFFILSFIALIASVKFNIGSFKLHIADQGIFNFPYIWHFNTYIAAILKFFLAIVIVSMMANEYSYGTLKQNLIDGMSKQEFVLSKFLTVVVFALASTLFVFVMSLILGYSFAKGILNFKVFPEGKTADNIMQFFPLESMGNLIVEPFSRLSVIKNIQTAIGGAGNVKDYSVHFTSLLIVLCWTAIFIFLSYKLLKKRDL